MRKIVKNKFKVLTTGVLAMMLTAIMLFGFSVPEEKVVEDNDYCCCAYKYQLSNPLAPTYYSWMQVKTCRKTFSGSCSGKSRQNCK